MEEVKQIYFIGPSNSGKTTTIENLIKNNKELNIGTIKFIHKGHHFQFDPDSKDTRRHRNAGSTYTLCFSPNETIILIPENSRASMDEFEKLKHILPNVDYLLIESFNNPEDDSRIILFVNTLEELQEYYSRIQGSNILGICCLEKNINEFKDVRIFDMKASSFISQLSKHIF